MLREESHTVDKSIIAFCLTANEKRVYVIMQYEYLVALLEKEGIIVFEKKLMPIYLKFKSPQKKFFY